MQIYPEREMDYYNLIVELFKYKTHLYEPNSSSVLDTRYCYGSFRLRRKESDPKGKYTTIHIARNGVSKITHKEGFWSDTDIKEEKMSLDEFMKEYDLKVPTKNI